MKIENAAISQSLIELSKTLEKKALTQENIQGGQQDEDAQAFVPTPLGSSGTYSVASLKAAVDYYAKFLTVAESNQQAVQHPPMIPQMILDRLNGR
jgi:hypothetical protein